MDVRPIADDADRAGFADVWTAITPREPLSGEDVRRRLESRPERLYLVAEQDGAVAACALTAWSDSPGRAFISVRVLPDTRRRGIGRALYQRAASSSHDGGPGTGRHSSRALRDRRAGRVRAGERYAKRHGKLKRSG